MANTIAANNVPMTREEKKVIFASSRGTVFEWYDFYIYGSLAAFIATVLGFAAGFFVRVGLRPPRRHDRPQAHHQGRPAAGGADLLPALQRADRSCQPRAGTCAGDLANLRQGPPEDLLIPGQPGGA